MKLIIAVIENMTKRYNAKFKLINKLLNKISNSATKIWVMYLVIGFKEYKSSNNPIIERGKIAKGREKYF